MNRDRAGAGRRAGRGPRVAAWLAPGLWLALLVPATAPVASPPDNPTPIAAEPFDPQASTATFTVVLRVTGPVPGRFGAIEGELEPAGENLWRVVVRVDTRALSVEGPNWMLRATRSAGFLDVARHPQVGFVSAPFPRDLLRKGGVLAGELDLRGQRRPVAFTLEAATCATPGHDCAIHVRGSVDRRDFGMTSQRLWLRDTVGFEFRVRLRPVPSP